MRPTLSNLTRFTVAIADQRAPETTAHSWLADSVFLDTETTGLGGNDEVVQIAIVDVDGTVLVDTLVKPHRPIPAEATAVHGITDDMVADAPAFDQVWPQVKAIVEAHPIVAYNADFDMRMIRQTLNACGIPEAIQVTYRCAMKLYSRFSGYSRWQTLGNALAQCGIAVQELHDAHADAEAARLLVRHVAGEAMASESEPQNSKAAP